MRLRLRQNGKNGYTRAFDSLHGACEFYTRTYPTALSSAPYQENPIQRNCREAVFFRQFNSLTAKELESVSRPFAPFRSAALGERPAICSNEIMIQLLLKTEAETAACEAVSETQRRENRDEKQPTPPPLGQWNTG
jgi:hypothetical protein